MGLLSGARTVLREWIAGVDAAKANDETQRLTVPLPSILSPYGPAQSLMPKPTPANLRRFAETPVVRRAINIIKDRIASMDWQVRVKREYLPGDVACLNRRCRALRAMLQEPNDADSFRTLIEQVLEDALVGGFGAIEMEATGNPLYPARLWPVDGATIQLNPRWNGDADSPRYAQRTGGIGPEATVSLRDDQLIYLRMNPRTHTPFGLGPLEVAFETVNSFLSAHRFAGKLASNAVVQYALWINEASPANHERLIRWWQDEIEGTGRVPILSTPQKPEVLRFATGTDADLRLSWQQFLIRMIANAFNLPPMLLGLEQDVNKSTSGEMGNEAFRSAILPLARLVEQHITRDLFSKLLGWSEFEFAFNELETRDELTELQIQTQLLQAGVLTVDEVRALRGLAPLQPPTSTSVSEEEEVETEG